MRLGLVIASTASACAVAVLAAMLIFSGQIGGAASGGAFSAPGLEPMSFEEAPREVYRMAPALLLVVYDAFGRTREDEI